MSILVKLSSSLRASRAGYDPLAGLAAEALPGETVAGLVRRLGLAAGDIKVIMVNGRKAGPETELKDGDRVGLFPPVGGG